MNVVENADGRDWEPRATAVARGIRRRVLEHTIRSQGGYLSQACSAAEILATLYTRVLRLGTAEAPAIPAPFLGVPSQHNPAIQPATPTTALTDRSWTVSSCRLRTTHWRSTPR